MINETDIDAFAEDNQEAIAAAAEYVRRAEKGLPPDRFTDGATGAKLVARGIHAMQCIMDAQNAALVAILADMQERGTDAMRLHKQDSKYNG